MSGVRKGEIACGGSGCEGDREVREWLRERLDKVGVKPFEYYV